MGYKKILFIFLFCFLFFAASAQAHMGGGPPFLQINGQFAKTSPYFQQEIMTLIIPQDEAPQSYVAGDTVTCAIDLEQLTQQTTIPPEMVPELTFRWSVATGENFEIVNKKYQYGSRVNYTFPKSKSYLLIVEAKSPLDDEYLVLDTVQLNIVPKSSYILPGVHVFIGIQGFASQPVLFVSQPRFDPSTTGKAYLWDFFDGKLYRGISIARQFEAMSPYNTRFTYHRIIDSNGLITDIGFAAENKKGTIQFVPMNQKKQGPFTVGTYGQAKSLIGDQPKIPITVMTWGIVMGLGVIFIGIFLFKKRAVVRE